MPLYQFKALTRAGDVLEGEMEGADRAAVIYRLQERGHIPIRAKQTRAGSLNHLLSRDIFGRDRLGAKQLAELTRELATLLGAGLTLDRALTILLELRQSAHNKADTQSKLIADLQAAVRGGSTLADAMASQGNIFDRAYIAMVQAGEESGALDGVFGRLAELLERSMALRESVKAAMVYPIILLITSLLSVVVLLTVVLPQFEPLFAEAGKSLPLATRIVLGVSAVVTETWWIAAIALAAIALAIWHLRRDPAFRLRWDRALLRLPIIGGVISRVAAARFGHTLATLAGNGVPLLRALAIYRAGVTNSAIATALDSAAEGLRQGHGLSQPLLESRVFPPLVGQLARVGEETGKLEPMLARIAAIHDVDVQRSIQRMLAMLNPLVTVTMGLIVAGIIIAILSAVLSINELAL